MKFENTQVYGFEGAIRGMRNPLESWHKSDSFFGIVNLEYPQDNREDVVDLWVMQELVRSHNQIEPYSKEWEELWEKYDLWLWDNSALQWDNDIAVVAALGPADLALAQKLVLAGPEHCKFLRQIFVSVDITAPIYWWKEFDTYKIGTTANSTSTMHKLTSKPITRDLFEFDDGENLIVNSGEAPHGGEWEFTFEDYIEDIVDICESLRQRYMETKDKRYWRALVQMLPQSWLQTRTVTTSYANLRNMYFQRRGHKLIEWSEFCDWIAQLPYGGELIMLEEKENEIN
jgi:hypothetical protein